MWRVERKKVGKRSARSSILRYGTGKLTSADRVADELVAGPDATILVDEGVEVVLRAGVGLAVARRDARLAGECHGAVEGEA